MSPLYGRRRSARSLSISCCMSICFTVADAVDCGSPLSELALVTLGAGSGVVDEPCGPSFVMRFVSVQDEVFLLLDRRSGGVVHEPRGQL